MSNTYSHNFTVYRAMTLKFGKLFDLAKYLGHTHKRFSVRGTAGGSSNIHIKFWYPFLSRKLIEVER